MGDGGGDGDVGIVDVDDFFHALFCLFLAVPYPS